MRLARGQIEKAKDQRAGEAEQTGGKRGAHAGERPREAGFQLLEQRADVARSDRHRVDHVGHRANGFQ